MKTAGSTVLDVLIVDDIALSRNELGQMLTGLGHRVHEAASGEDAVEIIQGRDIDLALIDLLMPGMDGMALTRAIRHLVRDRWLPIIVTSALDGEDHFIAAIENGADDYVTRPVQPSLLAARLQHLSRVLALQNRIAELAQRQGRINDNIVDAVITLNHLEQVEEANTASYRLLAGGPPHDLKGRSAEDVFGMNLTELMSRKPLRLGHGEHSFPAEVGMSEWLEEGQARYTLIIRDLTEQARIERMKDEFLATVSHELRTPLASIIGALGLLAAGATGNLPDSARTLTEVAYRNGQRLSRLVDDILDLTKLEGDRIVLQQRPVRVLDLVRESIAANEGYASRARVNLHLECSGTAVEKAEVVLDQERFLQIMANLSSNAIKHSGVGQAVRIRVHADDDRLSIAVKDQGPGIDPKFRARMFEKFSQSDASDRRAQGGTGLGLYISRLLVERMGGRITVDSSPGRGAEFCVDFPLAGMAGRTRLVRVIHVESDLDTRLRLARWLDKTCSLQSVASLNQAEVQLNGEGIPLLIANPRGQGDAEEFCGRLRRLAGPGPVILYSDSVDGAFAARLGFTWLPVSGTEQASFVDAVTAAIYPARKKDFA